MNTNLSGTVYHWLRKMKLPVSRKFLNTQLKVHMAFPSLLSITDTIEQLGLENTAIVVDKEKLNQVPAPFIAHIDITGGNFILITEKNRHNSRIVKQLKDWSGIVLLADPSTFTDNERNQEDFKLERKQQGLLNILVMLLGLLCAASLILAFSWHLLVMLITTSAGLVLAQAMIKKDLGIAADRLDEVCDWMSANGCAKALKKKKAGLMKWLPLADISLIWFSSLLLILPITALAGVYDSVTGSITILTTASIPITVYALNYQRTVLRSWCTLCIFITAILIIQIAGSWTLAGLPIMPTGKLVSSFSIIILATAIIAAFWAILRNSIKTALEQEENYLGVQKLKVNPGVFYTLLNHQKNTDMTSLKGDIQLGNSSAATQLLIACSPFCSPCARTHYALHGLLQQFNIGITIRFTVRVEKENPKAVAAAQVISAINWQKISGREEMINNWYKWMDLDKFKNVYQCQPATPEVWQELQLQQQWAIEVGIEGTPTIFLNGYRLPSGYSVTDLPLVLRNKAVADNSLIKTQIQTV